MSVVAISARPHPPGRPDRVPPARPRSAPTLTIILDLSAGPLTPRLARLVDLLGDLAEAGEGVVRLTEPAAVRTLPGPRPAPVAPDDDDRGSLRILAGSRTVRRAGGRSR